MAKAKAGADNLSWLKPKEDPTHDSPKKTPRAPKSPKESHNSIPKYKAKAEAGAGHLS